MRGRALGGRREVRLVRSLLDVANLIFKSARALVVSGVWGLVAGLMSSRIVN